MSEKLRELAFEYHKTTEQYDRSICRERRHGIAIPITLEERRMIDRNAKETLSSMTPKAIEAGFTESQFREAIYATASEFARHVGKLLSNNAE